MKEETAHFERRDPSQNGLVQESLFPIVLSEVNFLTFPFFCLSRKGLNTTTLVEYSKSIQRENESIDILWQVSSNSKFGFPGPFDKEVHKAIEALITQRGFPVSNPISFTLYELCKIMNINPHSGKNLQAIKDSLLRITMTGVYSKQTFYSKTEKRWIEEAFHLYDHVTFRGKHRPDTHEMAETNFLFLGKWYLDNLNSFYIKTLDYDFYRSLKSLIDKRYYEIMSVKFYGSFQAKIPFLRFRYSTLCDLFPLARYPYLSKAKGQLNPAHKRLIDQGFFSKVIWKQTNETNDWLLYFYPGDRAHELLNPHRMIQAAKLDSLGSFGEADGQMEFPFDFEALETVENFQDKYYKYYKIDNNNKEPDSEIQSGDQPDQSVVALLDRLTEFKIPEKLATQYLEKYPLAYLEEKIQIIEFKKSRDTRIKNTGGMLRRAIEEDWQPPEDLTVAKQKRGREIETSKRLQAEEKQAAIEQAKDRAVEEWISEASDSLVAKIQARAAREVREEHPETKDKFLRILNKVRVREIIVREYLDIDESKLLQEQAAK